MVHRFRWNRVFFLGFLSLLTITLFACNRPQNDTSITVQQPVGVLTSSVEVQQKEPVVSLDVSVSSTNVSDSSESNKMQVTSSLQPEANEQDVPIVTPAMNIESLPAPESLEQRFSYSYGYLVMDASMRDLQEIDPDFFIRGMIDYAYEKVPFIDRNQMNQVLFEYQDKLIAEASARLRELSERNLQQAEEFLKVNAARVNVKTTSSGLQYEIMKDSTGTKPGMNDTVKVHYKLTYLDGSVGDSSTKGIPSTFSLPSLIDGFKEGLMLMPVGSQYRFFVHPRLGYGSAGSVTIEPNTLLIYDVELVEIVIK